MEGMGGIGMCVRESLQGKQKVMWFLDGDVAARWWGCSLFVFSLWTFFFSFSFFLFICVREVYGLFFGVGVGLIGMMRWWYRGVF